MDELPKDCENCRHYDKPLKFSPCPMCNWQAATPSAWNVLLQAGRRIGACGSM